MRVALAALRSRERPTRQVEAWKTCRTYGAECSPAMVPSPYGLG